MLRTLPCFFSFYYFIIKRTTLKTRNPLILLVRLEGFEPPGHCLEDIKKPSGLLPV